MAAIPTCAVSVKLYDQNALAVPGATITAQLDRYEVHDGFVVPQMVEATTDAFGECTLDLWPNALGSQASSYKIKVQPTDAKGYSTVAVVPDAPTADLSLIAALPPVDSRPDFQEYFEQASGLADDLVNSANAAKIAAQAAQTAAAGSAIAADASAASAGAQAAAALASSQSAQQSANDAAASLSNTTAQAAAAAASATAASTSATNAGNSATAAGTSATNAANSATAAAGSATSAGTSAANAAASAAAVAPTITKPGDAAVTTGRVVNTVLIYDAPLTATRTVTLNATNPVAGDTVRLTRTAAATGAFNVALGTLKSLTAGQWAHATYDGAAWVLTAYGSL
ncbi:hypothetical protein [Cupriavidus basilensis]